MEIVDVIDKNGNIIGTATKDECHNNPRLIHQTVHFTLFDKKNRKVLLTQRSFKKKHDAGKICFLGEHVISGETLEEGLERGILEELGITVNKYNRLGQHLFKYQKETELVTFYIAHWNYEQIKFDDNELETIYWVDSKELINNLNKYSDMTKYWVKSINWDISSIE